MELTAIVGLSVVAVAIVVLLRREHPEFALLVSLLCSVLIFMELLRTIWPALQRVEGMLSQVVTQREYISVLLKSLGICFIVQIASECCRDAGEGAIASKIELAGKFSLVVMALPLFEELIAVALGFLSL